MTVVGLDSSVVVALWKPADALHVAAQNAAAEWEHRGATFILPAVVWSEVLTGVLRSSPERADVLERFRSDAVDEIVAIDESVAAVAAHLRSVDAGLR